MPHREPKFGKIRRQFKLGVGLKSAATYKGVSAAEIDQKMKGEKALVIPETLAGKITHKRYTELRKMGLQMGDIGALALMHERDQFPGELLFSGKKKQLLHKKYKWLRIKTRKELNARWIVMRDERIAELKAAKAKLDKKKAAKKKKVKSTKKETIEAIKKPKSSVLNKKGVAKMPRSIGKTLPVVPPTTSYTDGDLPETNAPQ